MELTLHELIGQVRAGAGRTGDAAGWSQLLGRCVLEHGPANGYAQAVHAWVLELIVARTGARLAAVQPSVEHVAGLVACQAQEAEFPGRLVLCGPQVLVLAVVRGLSGAGGEPELVGLEVVQGTCLCGAGLLSAATNAGELLSALRLRQQVVSGAGGLAGAVAGAGVSGGLRHAGPCPLGLSDGAVG